MSEAFTPLVKEFNYLRVFFISEGKKESHL